jgi:hypothetical protein
MLNSMFSRANLPYAATSDVSSSPVSRARLNTGRALPWLCISAAPINSTSRENVSSFSYPRPRWSSYSSSNRSAAQVNCNNRHEASANGNDRANSVT